MKFKVFDKNSQGTGVGNKAETTPKISVSENGVLFLNKPAMDLIGNDRIRIVQDEDKPKDWYLTPDNDGISFRKKMKYPKEKGIVQGYITNSMLVFKAMKSALGLVKVTSKMNIATAPITIDGQDYYAILTGSIH
jgi:hypothetical protein